MAWGEPLAEGEKPCCKQSNGRGCAYKFGKCTFCGKAKGQSHASKGGVQQPKDESKPEPPLATAENALAAAKVRSSLLHNTSVSLDEADGLLAEQLRDALVRNAVRVIDLFREWDSNGDGTVSKYEFREAMPQLGLRAPPSVVDAVFDEFDRGADGSIEFAELHKLLRRSTKGEAKKLPKGRVIHVGGRTIRLPATAKATVQRSASEPKTATAKPAPAGAIAAPLMSSSAAATTATTAAPDPYFVRPRVALLTSGSREQRAAAAYGLADLAQGDAAIKEAIVGAGGIAPLVALVQGGVTPEQKHAAVHALGCLAQAHPPNQDAVGAADGAIGALVALLRHGTSTTAQKQVCAFTLGRLAYRHPTNQHAIADAGAIRPLVHLAEGGTAEQRAGAAWALANLGHDDAALSEAIHRREHPPPPKARFAYRYCKGLPLRSVGGV